jgi:hypothetical protein
MCQSLLREPRGQHFFARVIQESKEVIMRIRDSRGTWQIHWGLNASHKDALRIFRPAGTAAPKDNYGNAVTLGFMANWHSVRVSAGGDYLKGAHGVNKAVLLDISRRFPHLIFRPTVGYRFSDVRQPYVGFHMDAGQTLLRPVLITEDLRHLKSICD